MTLDRLLLLFVLCLACVAVAPAASGQDAPPSAPNSLSFSPSDVLDAPTLLEKLTTQSDEVSGFLWSGFPPEVQEVLTNADALLPEQLSAMVAELNAVLEGNTIYDAERFAGVALSPEVLMLIQQDPQGADLYRLNRLLLEDAYRSELERSPPMALVARPATGVSTDQSDYAPGATASIRGWGFEGGETVGLQVLHADETPDTGEDHGSWSVDADPDGEFQTTWHVCEDDCLGSTLRLTATGESSGSSAQVTFTDAAGAPTFEQLKSFGEPSLGGAPDAELIQGMDGALYGTAYRGGTYNYGTVFKLNTDGTGFVVLKNFDNSTTGGNPYAGLLQGSDGVLYGTTSGGGSGTAGTVFKLNTDGTGFTVLKHLVSSTTGAFPRATLIQGTDGALYGAASGGGTSGYGTVFKLNTNGTGFTVLRNFDYSTTGAYPYAGLVQGTDGTLYGAAYQGGTSGSGTVFKLNTDGTGFSVLKHFSNSTTGGNLSAALLQATDGALYSTTSLGGTSNYGTIFKLNTDGTGFTVLKNFDYFTTGASPVCEMVQGMDGLLYGTASRGGTIGYGAVFKLNTDGTGFSILKNFDNSAAGGDLRAALLEDADGVLYSTAAGGGSTGSGTVFKLNTNGTGFTVLKNLSALPNTAADGGTPYSGLTQGADGALYGTASRGGSNGYGTVFKLNRDGTGFTVLKHFNNSTTGGSPNGGLVQGTDGVLYGTAYQGGSSGWGTAFKLNTDGTGFTVLKHFNYSTNGGYPYGWLVQGTDGALYGTAYQGGTSGYGTVFKMNTDGTGFTTLKNFDYSSTGGYLQAGLMQGTDGALYGTAQYGGTSGYGTVFKLNTNGTGFTVLKHFNYSATGGYPSGVLMQGTDGALYGTAANGGSSTYGTVYKLNADGTGFTILKQNFIIATTGAYLFNGLVQGTDGALYGTAQQGGSSSNGTLFKLNTDGTGFTVLQNFDGPTAGGSPSGWLLRGTDGNLYGATSGGGGANAGTLYRLVFDTPPVANAGADFSVNEGQPVMLDGTGSGPEPGALAYAWAQLPGGPPVTLTGAATATPTFTAPSVAIGGETLSFELTVTANGQHSTDTVSVTVVNVNHPPVADAGDDQSIAEGAPVTLHGEDSFDIDCDVFAYSWVQVAGTPTVSLAGADTANPTFTAPFVDVGGIPGVVATLVFELTVDDGFPPDAPAPGYSLANVLDSVTVEITNVNNDPIARAGDDQTVNENTAVALNGGTSSDPDDDELSFQWTQIGGPAVTLAGQLTVTPSFTTPFVSPGGENLTFELAVDDGFGGTDTDTVVINVQNTNDPPLASAAQPTIGLVWPPNHALVLVGIIGVSDPNNNATITITGVTQDEATNGLGDGDTPIDAVINSNGTVLLRAERSGTGNGRVYHIHFTASDLEGSASGIVTVSVPHQKKSVAIDGGELYDSTQ